MYRKLLLENVLFSHPKDQVNCPAKATALILIEVIVFIA